MRAVKKTVYQADDGTEWETPAACRLYEMSATIEAALERIGSSLSVAGAVQVYETLKEIMDTPQPAPCLCADVTARAERCPVHGEEHAKEASPHGMPLKRPDVPPYPHPYPFDANVAPRPENRPLRASVAETRASEACRDEPKRKTGRDLADFVD